VASLDWKGWSQFHLQRLGKAEAFQDFLSQPVHWTSPHRCEEVKGRSSLAFYSLILSSLSYPLPVGILLARDKTQSSRVSFCSGCSSFATKAVCEWICSPMIKKALLDGNHPMPMPIFSTSGYPHSCFLSCLPQAASHSCQFKEGKTPNSHEAHWSGAILRSEGDTVGGLFTDSLTIFWGDKFLTGTLSVANYGC
jgi:hypothetical protein